MGCIGRNDLQPRVPNQQGAWSWQLLQEISMRKILQSVASVAGLVFATVVLAHHSFAMFDKERKVELHGTVKRFEWTNPHIWIDLIAETPNGEQVWGVEGGSPSVLTHSGFDKNVLSRGMKVTLSINPLKNGSYGGSLLTVTLPDGRVLDAGPSGSQGSPGPGPAAQSGGK